jgi:hypothetical protein
VFGIIEVHVPGVADELSPRSVAIEEYSIWVFLDHQEASATQLFPYVFSPG